MKPVFGNGATAPIGPAGILHAVDPFGVEDGRIQPGALVDRIFKGLLRLDIVKIQKVHDGHPFLLFEIERGIYPALPMNSNRTTAGT